MTRTTATLALTALFALTAMTVAASPVLTEDDFESYVTGELGTVSGGNWTVVQGTATVQDTVTNEGSRAVQLANDTIIDRALSAPGEQIVYTRSYYRGAGTTSDPNYPADPASAIVHFAAGGSEGTGILLANGDGSGGVAWQASSVTSITPTTFYEVTIRQNYSTHQWDCWINGALEGQNLGFRDNSVNALSGFRAYAGVESYLDTFVVRRPSTSDLNEDGAFDATDVVLNVERDGQTPPTLDIFDFLNADADGSGAIDATDVGQTVTAVLTN